MPYNGYVSREHLGRQSSPIGGVYLLTVYDTFSPGIRESRVVTTTPTVAVSLPTDCSILPGYVALLLEVRAHLKAQFLRCLELFTLVNTSHGSN